MRSGAYPIGVARSGDGAGRAMDGQGIRTGWAGLERIESAEPSFRRVAVRGRGFVLGGLPFTVRGVTYGAFRLNTAEEPFPEPARVERDFEAMAAHGVNAVRVYTPPPLWLLDLAQAHDIRVLAGLWRFARRFIYSTSARSTTKRKQ